MNTNIYLEEHVGSGQRGVGIGLGLLVNVMASLSSSPLLIYYIYYFATLLPCSSHLLLYYYYHCTTLSSIIAQPPRQRQILLLTPPIYILRFIFRVRVFVFHSFYFPRSYRRRPSILLSIYRSVHCVCVGFSIFFFVVFHCLSFYYIVWYGMEY